MPDILVAETAESIVTEVMTQLSPPEPGHSVRVQFNDTSVAVFNSGGKLFALEAKCGHRDGPLDQGTVSDGAVRCPWHGAKFDLKTGEVVGGNFFIRRATKPVRSFQAREVGGLLVLSERQTSAGSDRISSEAPLVTALAGPA
jgi:nitrite reductase/ring-hydroxylating ferredoxin subunit